MNKVEKQTKSSALTNTACFHCGETIPHGFTAELNIQHQTQAFCCYGCLAVAEMILSDGLENFYQHRSALAPKPDEFSARQQQELKLYDDPALQQDFVIDNEEQFREASLSISGITCAACIWLLEKEITTLPGVVRLTINHSSHKAILVWDPKVGNLSDSLIRIRQLGYQGFPYHRSQVKERTQKERRTTIFRIAVAGIAMMQNMMFSVPLYLGMYSGIDANLLSLFRWVSLFMSLPVVLFAALPFYRAAWRSLKAGHLTMDLPVSIAILAAFGASCVVTLLQADSLEADVYFDSVAMFTFFLLLGRYIEMQTRHKHLDIDASMGDLLPATATRLEDDIETGIPSQLIDLGDQLLVRQGQTVPADGIITEGSSRFDESALSGEYLPVLKAQGAHISAGTANVENSVTMKVTAIPKASRVSTIIRLLDHAAAEKPDTAIMADRVASYFIALVLGACTLTGFYWYFHDIDRVFPIVLAVLVVTCPCALSLATPTALTAANTALQKLGFLITKGHVLEALTSSTDVIFDKTGTLTEGVLELAETNCYANYDEAQVLAIAAALEAHSSHPIAKVFEPYFALAAKQVSTRLGKGLQGQLNGRDYFLGNWKFISEQTPQLNPQQTRHTTPHAGACIYLSDGKQLLARFLLRDKVREDARACVSALQSSGIRVHILSGDHQFSVRHTALELGIKHLKAEQSPEEKLAYVRKLQTEGCQVTMVGDGINDLPVLSGARLSIAMGNASDLAKLNSDAILLNERLSVLAEAFDRARNGRKVIKQNITWAILYNITMLPLAAAGMIPPYFAALGMSISSLAVVFNSLRLRN